MALEFAMMIICGVCAHGIYLQDLKDRLVLFFQEVDRDLFPEAEAVAHAVSRPPVVVRVAEHIGLWMLY